MAKRNQQIKVDSLARFLAYVLGRRPDEFGLVPDSDGSVTVKELLQAVHEEPGWQYVRRSHINEVLLGKDRALFQAEKERISVLEKLWSLECETPSEALPKILFTPVRTRAHPVVMEKGLKPGEGKCLVLSPDREMALRIGKRRDHNPIILEIMACAAASKGILFFPFGILFLSQDIPAKFISGPPVSKEVMERRSEAEAKKDKAVPGAPVEFAAGSFTLDPFRDPDLRRRAKGKKRRGWKEDARKIRRGKG